jgi:hypothetical protein
MLRTGMLSMLHVPRNPRASWGVVAAFNSPQSIGTIPLNLLWNRHDFG